MRWFRRRRTQPSCTRCEHCTGLLADGDTVLRPGQTRAADVLRQNTDRYPVVPALDWPGNSRTPNRRHTRG